MSEVKPLIVRVSAFTLINNINMEFTNISYAPSLNSDLVSFLVSGINATLAVLNYTDLVGG